VNHLNISRIQQAIHWKEIKLIRQKKIQTILCALYLQWFINITVLNLHVTICVQSCSLISESRALASLEIRFSFLFKLQKGAKIKSFKKKEENREHNINEDTKKFDLIHLLKSLNIVPLLSCQTTRTLDILYVMAEVLCSVRFM